MLQALELSGFKSFADRTRFDFDPGITGVVGPNGSGKSNVVDALKWILGVQSAKSLRGKSMADVIFNGASGRKPANAAEATLHFDNRARTLDIDLDEVRIGRRLLRSGDSEYLVNDNSVRLKDVVQLFMGTGAGSNAYSIIEQGRVDQILQANASARRKVFDEAAGISRFRADRLEAERKLERVEQNLVRLRDIVDEVESRLASVRSQAEKAAKYRELTEELRVLWWGLAADDCRRIDGRLAELAATAGDANEGGDEFEQRIASIETRLAVVDEDLGRIDDAYRAADRALAAQRESAATHETTIRHERERLVDLESDVTRLRRQRATLAAREREAELEFDRTSRQVDEFERSFADLRESLDDHETAIAEATAATNAARDEAESRRTELLEAVKHGTKLDNDVVALEAEVESLVRDRAEAATAIDDLAESLARCDDEREEAEREAERAAGDVRLATEARDEVRDRRREIVDRLDEFQRAIADRRETRSAGRARLAVLEDLESRREGFGIGVREILDRARTLPEAPWNSIRGTVADLLDVDLEHAAVVEIALGHRAQTIVVDDIAPLREYLRLGGTALSGRVGFVAYDRSQGGWLGLSDEGANPQNVPLGVRSSVAPPQPPDATADDPQSSTGLTEEPGVVTRADRLVRSPDDLPGLARQLLADTWVVDSLDVGYRLRAEASGGFRFVTPLGELLEVDGTLHVGTVLGEAAVVSRKSELRGVRNELARLDREIDSEQDRAELLGEDLVGVEAELETADEAVRTAQEVLAERRGTVERRDAERARVASDHTAAIERADALDERTNACGKKLDALRDERLDWEANVTELRAEIEEAERTVDRRAEAIRTHERERDEQRLALAKQEERLDGLLVARDRILADLEQRREQLAESRRRVGVVEGKRREATLHMLNARARLDESILQRDRIARESADLAAERRDLRADRKVIDAEAASARAEQREAEAQWHRVEIERRELEHERRALAERIDEEYDTTLETIVASGVSAYDDYVAEHAPASTPAGREPDTPENDSDDPSSSALEPGSTSRGASFDVAAEFSPDDVREELQSRVDRLRRRIKSMGSVGVESLHDLDELETRFTRLSTQLEDLEHARDELRDVVRRINVECKRLFVESFETIRGHFRELFRKLFGGGEGDVVLEDPDDPLECGVEIVARPPGKELRNLSLLSGGERTMTAVALLMSIFKSNPSPFCVLDEVDAALDEANVERYNAVLREFADATQFIVVTHRKPTMTVCDVLYGVTMEESGVSKRMTVRFEDVNEDGEFTVPRAAA